MIIVTGGSDGLGYRILAEAKTAGFDTMNISRRSNSEANVNLLADLSTEEGLEAACSAILEKKSPKALVLNAGVLSLGELTSVTPEEYDRVFDVNFKAPLLMIARLYDWILKHEVDVVFINSTAGIKLYKNQMIYNTSKWALKGLADNFREEVRDFGVRVISVHSDMLDTDMSSKLPSGPMPKSKHPAIDSGYLAKMIIESIKSPKSMQISDIVIDRKVIRTKY